ncbi:MAG TPA: MBL fold metallo-hydrolase, partial [Vicinamibacterales bacterium]|nr:MBL fold metallo-hydrolase [Vicinamibacterales bacterium]
MPEYPVSDHCDGERFFNPYENARPLSDVIKWARTRQRTPWPSHVPLQPHDPPPTRVDPGRVAVTFIGHSTFLLRTASSVILTDPVFTTHAGPFGRLGPARVRPPGIAATALPPVDIVLVSHNHYDHLQPSSLRRFRESATFVAPLGVGGQLGLPPGRKIDERRPETRKIHELDWWQTTRIGNAEITC